MTTLHCYIEQRRHFCMGLSSKDGFALVSQFLHGSYETASSVIITDLIAGMAVQPRGPGGHPADSVQEFRGPGPALQLQHRRGL
jgi:hypothetical protein